MSHCISSFPKPTTRQAMGHVRYPKENSRVWIMRRYTTLGKSIWVIITRGYGNHKCNIEFITSGRRPRVINSILHE